MNTILRLIIILAIAQLLQAQSFSKKYDFLFRTEYNKHFYVYKDFYSWKIVKAQAIQESRLKPHVFSPVGAAGLMQIMPATEAQLKKQLGLAAHETALVPDAAIKMGVFYDKSLFNMWKSKRTLESRYQLMFASYNAGAGNLLRAQRKCMAWQRNVTGLNCNEYKMIEFFLEDITGRHAQETIGYNKRIFMYYKLLD